MNALIPKMTTKELIKYVATLHRSRWRTHNNQYIAEGLRCITTIVEAGHELVYLFATDEYKDIAHDIAQPEVVYEVSESVMKKISPSAQAPGLLAVCTIPPQPDFDLIDTGIVLADISDPGNMGTLIRSCVAFGKKTVICVKGCDPWNPKVVQASAGTIALARIFRISWRELIAHKQQYTLCALVVSNGTAPENLDLQNSLLVIGNEAHGIPREWIEDCEQKLTLPMPGGAESLNAAVAGSISMYKAWI